MRIVLPLIIMLYAVLIITDYVIITDLRRFEKNRAAAKGRNARGVWWIVYLVFSILVLGEVTVALCLPTKSLASELSPVMWLLFIAITVAISQIIYTFCSLLSWIPRIFRKKRWLTGLWLGLPLSLIVFILLWWGVLIGRYRIDTENVEISSHRLPESFEGYRIAQISDLHVGTWRNDTTFVSYLVDSVNSLNPDLIVFTGDIVNRRTDELLPFVTVLSRLRAKDGVYSILGNHDYGDYARWPTPEEKVANLEELKALQKKMGWSMLNNSHAYIRNEQGDSILLIGVENWGEPPFSQYGDLAVAYPDYPSKNETFKILLSHNPEHWNEIVSENSNIDLTLSGHTHAMQMMISLGNWKWSPASFKYRHWGGLYQNESPDKGKNLYVNIGAGEVGLPMRLGADPEITVFTLKRGKE